MIHRGEASKLVVKLREAEGGATKRGKRIRYFGVGGDISGFGFWCMAQEN